jgi:DNA end-binding protein Ku
MARPYWSGHLQISLVSFGIQLFPATEAKSEIHFHQLSRKTGERVKHQNVAEDESPVAKEDIVKGYEYTKGEYVVIEPEDIDNLRIPSRKTLDVTQFVGLDELDPKYFEKPYFVVPENSTQAEAFAVVRKALQTTRKVALGKIAFGGREHLVAITSPADDSELGMMAYMMRYAEELRDPGEYFAEIKKITIDDDQLALAKELINRKAAKFDPAKFTDDYEQALRAMVEAKVNHAPAPKEAPEAKSPKVVNFMDALRKSVQSDSAGKSVEVKQTSVPVRKNTPAKSAASSKKMALVSSSKPKAAKKRRTA